MGPGRDAPREDEEQPSDAARRTNVLLPHRRLRQGCQLGGCPGVPHGDESCWTGVSSSLFLYVRSLMLSVTVVPTRMLVVSLETLEIQRIWFGGVTNKGEMHPPPLPVFSRMVGFSKCVPRKDSRMVTCLEPFLHTIFWTPPLIGVLPKLARSWSSPLGSL